MTTTSSTGPCEQYGRLYAVDVATGRVLSEVLVSYRDSAGLALSPDGQQVAYVRGDDLYVKPTSGGAATRVNTGRSHVDLSAMWSTDGALWFVSDMGSKKGRAALWRQAPNGSLMSVANLDHVQE